MKKILVLLLLAFPVCLSAQDNLLGRLIEANSPSSLKASFTMVRHTPMLTEDIRCNGVLYMQAPDLLRWEIISPSPRVSILNPGDGKGRRFTLPSERDFKVESLTDAKAISVKLTPLRKDLARVFSQIVLKADPESLRIREVLLNGYDNEYTSLTFSEVQTDLKLDPELFK